MEILMSWLIATLLILVVAYVLPGITLTGFVPALMVALMVGLVNAFLKPILIVLTLPINILTLGLFTFVINAFLILIVAAIVPGFSVNSFWSALLFSVGLTIGNFLINLIF